MSADATMWGGRFTGRADELFRRFNDSLRFDWALVGHDIAGSIAWAGALGEAGVLAGDEVEALTGALETLGADAAALTAPPVESGAEDVHSWVEARLIESLGDLGKKLHTGRSRNDQVATDLRLWCRGAIDEQVARIRAAQRALVDQASKLLDVPAPAYTHLQRAQPILLAHWCMAYVDMLDRDADRLADARRRVNVCPLGSGALTGTAYRIDREKLARALGFDAPAGNSLDAVSDRDFVVETLSAAALTAVHLSRLGEDLVLYATDEFSLVRFDDATTSGSSIMPQKKNPDALELIRGKAGRIAGAHQAMLMTLKGLPLAYNKDLQEDKELLFDAMGQLGLCLEMLTRVLGGMTVDRDRCAAAAAGGLANATEMADYLVGRGVPFREAHDQVGTLVRLAIETGRSLEGLSLDEIRSVAPDAGAEVYEWLGVDSGIARRDAIGGTSRRRVAEAISAASRRLEDAGGES